MFFLLGRMRLSIRCGHGNDVFMCLPANFACFTGKALLDILMKISTQVLDYSAEVKFFFDRAVEIELLLLRNV